MTTRLPYRLPSLLLASVFVLSGCASGPPPGPSPEQIAGMNAKTILVTPFNIVSPLPPDLEGATRLVGSTLVEHLEAHGKTVRVIGVRAGRDLWKASMREVRDSGQPRKFENAAKVYARKLGEIVEFDALIVPSLFVQNAKMRARTVRWDGAEQTIQIHGRGGTNPGNSYQGNLGTLNVRAASIFVHVLDRDGNSIQTKRAGLELIQHLEFKVERKGGQSGTDQIFQGLVNDNPPIENREMVGAGVAASLSPFLSEDVPEELPSPSDSETPEADTTTEEAGSAEAS